MRRNDLLGIVLTILADLGFLWVLVYFGFGGAENANLLLASFGPLAWILLGMVLFLLLFHSDYRTDLPLFAAGFTLGYWGEWWGTTRDIWTYWNGATPPGYLPPLWGLGLITVYRLSQLLYPLLPEDLPCWAKWGMTGSFVILPSLAFVHSWPLIMSVEWRGRLDVHFIAGLGVAGFLILHSFDLRRDFLLFICGSCLGALYEYLGTTLGEWTYATGETPPLWIAPLWGLACVAMTNLALQTRGIIQAIFRKFSNPGFR
jgi:hypothetical protein